MPAGWCIPRAPQRLRRASPILSLFAAALAAAALVVHDPRPASAHAAPSVGQSKIRQDEEVVRYDLAVSHDRLIELLDGGDGIDGMGRQSDAEAASALRSRKAELAAVIASHVRSTSTKWSAGARFGRSTSSARGRRCTPPWH